MAASGDADTGAGARDAPPDGLRIVCLTPSATDICVALGLAAAVVGVTHECDRTSLPPDVRVVTRDGLRAGDNEEGASEAELSQAEIHRRVSHAACSIGSPLPSGGGDGDGGDPPLPPSLYPILPAELRAAGATLILTQDLCAVCAPTPARIAAALGGGAAGDAPGRPRVLSLHPQALRDVGDDIRRVGAAGGVAPRAAVVAAQFQRDLDRVRALVAEHVTASPTRTPRRRLLLLEWLDPPMDGGHWIPDLLDCAGLEDAAAAATHHRGATAPRKSQPVTWRKIQEEMRPDVILVACCGFDLARNLRDARSARRELLTAVVPEDNGATTTPPRVWAANGDLCFARPGPRLVVGAAILALCAHGEEHPALTRALLAEPFLEGLNVEDLYRPVDLSGTGDPAPPGPANVVDVEDAFVLHTRACQNKESFYRDPETGYMVFTEYAHLSRGHCCGSGCRHCPYAHANVKDKAARIQVPAMIYAGEDDDGAEPRLRLRHGRVRVLFFSGGKDSFLALRALARASAAAPAPFGVCLLTTFDAISRQLAHQDLAIDAIERQARHLGVALVGVPLPRGDSQTYLHRVREGIRVLEARIDGKVSALVFGDLHLEHIVAWRRENLGPLGLELVFPLLGVSYETLANDLERSGVPCVISSSTVPDVSVGETYNKVLRDKLTSEFQNIDTFGETGEFHTEAQVWQVERSRALFG